MGIETEKSETTAYPRTKAGQALYSFTVKAGCFLVRHRALAQILGVTWGCLGLLIGLVEMIVVNVLPCKRSYGNFNGFPFVMFGDNWGGLEGGFCFFVADNMGDEWTLHTKRHETGHCFQNAVFGPFMVFLVMIPSAIRYWIRKAKPSSVPYDAVWYEGSSTEIGTYYDEVCNSKGDGI